MTLLSARSCAEWGCNHRMTDLEPTATFYLFEDGVGFAFDLDDREWTGERYAQLLSAAYIAAAQSGCEVSAIDEVLADIVDARGAMAKPAADMEGNGDKTEFDPTPVIGYASASERHAIGQNLTAPETPSDRPDDGGRS